MELEISASRKGDACVLSVSGEVDVHTAPVLKAALLDAASGGCAVLVVDLSGVPFIDSSGLGVLIGALSRAREAGGDVRLAAPAEQVAKILRITGLDRVLPIYGSASEAAEA